MSEDSLEIKLSFKEVKVTLDDSVSGKKRRFVLRELTGASRDLYLTEAHKKAEVGADGFNRVVNFAGSCSSLLSKMLFEIRNVDGLDEVSKTALPEAEIQAWPSSVQLRLFHKAQEISGLNEEAEVEAKNDLPSESESSGSA